MKKEIIISGFGGQGVMLAGTLLCYAGLREGKQVTFFPSYGAEMRGGTANSQVIIADTPIGAPVVYNPDVLLCLNKPSFDKFSSRVKKGGLILANSSLYKPQKVDGIEIIEVPANELAEKVGSGLVLNAVMLGALVFKTGVLDLDSLINSIEELLSEKKKALWEINKKAVLSGADYLKS